MKKNFFIIVMIVIPSSLLLWGFYKVEPTASGSTSAWRYPDLLLNAKKDIQQTLAKSGAMASTLLDRGVSSFEAGALHETKVAANAIAGAIGKTIQNSKDAFLTNYPAEIIALQNQLLVAKQAIDLEKQKYDVLAKSLCGK